MTQDYHLWRWPLVLVSAVLFAMLVMPALQPVCGGAKLH